MVLDGLHNILSNKIYSENDEYAILDIDISSLYPTFILNYHAFRFIEVEQQYKQIRTFRLTETKPNLAKYKGKPEELYWKQKDLFYKVVLNGVSGHLDSEHSWLYNPEGIMKVRCGGQLVLLTIIEQCILKNIQVLQANTDGITVRILRSKIPEFEQLVTVTEKKYNIEFEYAYYSKMIFSSVNSYLAVETNNKVKEKGEFVTKPELGNSTDFMIVPHLLSDYFIRNIKPEVAIHNYKSIFLFCASQKVDKSYTVEWNNQKQQRLNRYFVSRKGSYLYKVRNGSKSHLLKGFGVQLYNKHEEQPFENYKIDYGFYLKMVNDKISELENKNQLQLF